MFCIRTIAITVIFAVLTGCASTQTAQQKNSYDAVRLGDNNLTCDELYKEVTDLQDGVSKESAAADKAIDKTTTIYTASNAATTAAGYMSSVPGIGFITSAIGNGAQMLGNSAVEDHVASSTNAQNMHARAQHLTEIFNNKGCKTPSKKAKSSVAK